MRDLIKSVALWASIAFIPLNMDSKDLNSAKVMKDKTNSELFMNFGKENFSGFVSNGENLECQNFTPISPRIIINAALKYFDEEIRAFDLSLEAKQEISKILAQYLAVHSILKVWSDRNVIFVIENKKDFSNMMKQLVKVIIDDMPFLLRRVAIPVFFGWVSSIQRSLDNLDVTAMNMKEKQYKSVVFDYMWWIVKRVLISINGDMKIWDYYNSVRRYYPNRNSDKIMQELETLWLKDKDVKNLVYPFKK